jgi:tetratricopeptide (TPR) repeat protein
MMLVAKSARADEQKLLLAAAAEAEARAEPTRALELYRQAEAVEPRARLARRARSRIEWLEERSAQQFVPLAALMRARIEFSVAPSADALAAFSQLARSFAPGHVRRESLELVAHSYLRIERLSEALDAYLAWGAEPGASEAERQLAQSGAAIARAQLGHSARAIADLDRQGLGVRSEARYLRAESVAQIGSRVAKGMLGLFGIALALAVRHRRSRFDWRGARAFALLAAFALAPPLVMVSCYEPQLVHALLGPVAACGAVLVLASVAARSFCPPTRLRRALGATSALAVVSAAFLVAAKNGLVTELVMAALEPR